MDLPPFLRSILAWVRAGYPDGVPDVDYLPLFALLGSQLTDAEVRAVADQLASSAAPDSADVLRAAIQMVTHQSAKDSDIARVKARLAAGGWPLAKPDRRTWPDEAKSTTA